MQVGAGDTSKESFSSASGTSEDSIKQFALDEIINHQRAPAVGSQVPKLWAIVFGAHKLNGHRVRVRDQANWQQESLDAGLAVGSATPTAASVRQLIDNYTMLR